MKTRKELVIKISIGVLVATIVGVMIWLLWNQFQTVRGIRDEIITEVAYVEQIEQQIGKLIEFKEQPEAIKERLISIGDSMPPDLGEDYIVTYLMEAAGYPGSKVADIRFRDRTSTTDRVDIPVEMHFEGRYHGLLSLLHNLYNGSRTVRVNDIRISGGSGGLPQIKAVLSLTMFSLKK